MVVACESDEDVVKPYKPINLDLKAQSVVVASNQFGFNVFNEMTDGSDDNLMISPLSISQALSMIWNGADGLTFDEMSSVLCFPDEPTETINQSNRLIRQSILNADSRVKTNVANSIWYRDSYLVVDDFIETNERYYDAEVTPLDFTQAEASKKTINNWVNNQTNGRIPTIVDQISADHIMFLINAVYFKGVWTYQFDKEKTANDIFHLNDGNTIQVPMMNMEADLDYFSDELCSGLTIPYGNEHFEMVIMLPAESTSLPELIEVLDDERWNDYMLNKTTRGIELSLPKFKFENDLKLKSVLTKLGMETAFSDAANFSNVGGGVKISKVKHKTFVEVNEEGTEAAAVTSVEVTLTSVGGDSSYNQFKVNRPFLFAIREKDTGAILFLGQMYNPQE